MGPTRPEKYFTLKLKFEIELMAAKRHADRNFIAEKNYFHVSNTKRRYPGLFYAGLKAFIRLPIFEPISHGKQLQYFLPFIIILILMT